MGSSRTFTNGISKRNILSTTPDGTAKYAKQKINQQE